MTETDKDDLVARLREESLTLARRSFDSVDAGISANLCDAAIDEIERLRLQLAQANKEIGILRDMLLNPDPNSEPDVIRLHREKCDMYDRAIAAELQLAKAKSMAQFVRWAMQEGAWDGCDLDGGSIQEKALELGLIVQTTYDPEKHGDADYCPEPGDEWYELAPEIQSALADDIGNSESAND